MGRTAGAEGQRDSALPARPQVVYIGGTDRSGSTLLALLLGGHPSILVAGELHLLGHEFADGPAHLPCGCGRPVADCPFWQDVVTAADPDGDARGGLSRFRESHQHARGIRPLALVRGLASVRVRPDVAGYGRQSADLYRAMAQADRRSGRDPRYVVDASKDPYRLLWLAQSGEVELRVIHLTRHPGGFARSVIRRDEPTASVRRQVALTARKTVTWDVTTMGILGLRRRHLAPEQYLHIRYEDLSRDPDATLDHIGGFLGIELPHEVVERYPAVETHALGGNPMRFERRPIALDERWRTDLTPPARVAARALSLPARALLAFQRTAEPPSGPTGRRSHR